MMCFKHLDTVRVQHAESTLDSLGLTDEAEIVAWEAECEDVDGCEGRNVELPDIAMMDGPGRLRTDVVDVGSTTVLIVIRCPPVDDPVVVAPVMV